MDITNVGNGNVIWFFYGRNEIGPFQTVFNVRGITRITGFVRKQQFFFFVFHRGIRTDFTIVYSALWLKMSLPPKSSSIQRRNKYHSQNTRTPIVVTVSTKARQKPFNVDLTRFDTKTICGRLRKTTSANDSRTMWSKQTKSPRITITTVKKQKEPKRSLLSTDSACYFMFLQRILKKPVSKNCPTTLLRVIKILPLLWVTDGK